MQVETSNESKMMHIILALIFLAKQFLSYHIAGSEENDWLC